MVEGHMLGALYAPELGLLPIVLHLRAHIKVPTLIATEVVQESAHFTHTLCYTQTGVVSGSMNHL